MSRSRKKTKIRANTTSVTEKKNKRDSNRKLRRKVNQRVKQGDSVLPELREVSDVWAFDKDGKKYDHTLTQKEMRK